MKAKLMINACLFLLLMAGCGKDGGIAGLFIPNFSNLWFSSRNTTFQFNPTTTNVSKGEFTGTEENGFNDFEGTFNNYDIEFTITEGNEKGVRYTGKFTKENPLTMEVKGTNNQELTISKN